MHSYPLKLHFKFIALAPRISVNDASGEEILYIEQKIFAFKEAVKVFNNSREKKLLYTMQADQVIDFGARYYFKTADKKHNLGYLQQEGMRSIVQASYLIFDKHGKQAFKIVQSNPAIAIVDSLLNIIPYVGLVTGFFLNPTYLVTHATSHETIFNMKKKPSFLESTFVIDCDQEKLSEEQETLLLLSLLMTVQLERNRG